MNLFLFKLPLLNRRRCNQMLLLILGISMQVPMNAAVSTATVTANIIRPVSMNTQNGLSFADISVKKSAGTVVLSPDGNRATTGGTSIKSSVPSEPAAFTVSGEPNAAYTISLPEASVLTNSQGSTMVVTKFTSLPAISGLIDANGQQELFVGGTLNVGNNQAYGPYTGTMVVTIQYN
jgi:hypothetical protein